MGREQIVVMFHGIGTPRPELPPAEPPYWIGRERFEDIVELVAGRRWRREVVWTFDDGNASDLWAAERLAARGLHGKFYLLTQRFGRKHYVSPDGARALAAMGMEVGLHGHAHVDWRFSPPDELRTETITARRELADAVGKPVTSVALPFGGYNRRVLAHLEAQGFERIYNSDGGPSAPGDRFVRRTAIRADQSMDDILAILEDRVGYPKRLRRTIAPMVKRLR